MALSWTWCMADQVTNLDPVGDWFCLIFGGKGYMVRPSIVLWVTFVV